MLINIDKLTDQWASQKYSIVFEKNKILDVKLASLAKNCFAEMGINDLYMNVIYTFLFVGFVFCV